MPNEGRPAAGSVTFPTLPVTTCNHSRTAPIGSPIRPGRPAVGRKPK